MDMTNLPILVGRRLLYFTLHVLLIWSIMHDFPPSLCCCTKSHIATNTSLTCISPLHMHTVILFFVSCCTHHIWTPFWNWKFLPISSQLLHKYPLKLWYYAHWATVISYLCIQGTINISHAILYSLLVQKIHVFHKNHVQILAHVCPHWYILKHFSTYSKVKNITTLNLNFRHKASNLVCHNIYSFRIFVCTPA